MCNVPTTKVCFVIWREIAMHNNKIATTTWCFLSDSIKHIRIKQMNASAQCNTSTPTTIVFIFRRLKRWTCARFVCLFPPFEINNLRKIGALESKTNRILFQAEYTQTQAWLNDCYVSWLSHQIYKPIKITIKLAEQKIQKTKKRYEFNRFPTIYILFGFCLMWSYCDVFNTHTVCVCVWIT